MSKEEKPIHYEPHPVSQERKAELIAKGVRIVDAAYAPKADKGPAEIGEADGAHKATVPELRAALAAKGIDVPDGAKKADLQALLDAAN